MEYRSYYEKCQEKNVRITKKSYKIIIMSTGDRLKKLIKEIGVKNSEFAESIGLSSGGLSDIISGRNKA
jgi:plasmid maintenance system antidote protein VapI